VGETGLRMGKAALAHDSHVLQRALLCSNAIKTRSHNNHKAKMEPVQRMPKQRLPAIQDRRWKTGDLKIWRSGEARWSGAVG